MYRHQVHVVRSTGFMAQASVVVLSALLLTSIDAAAQMKMDNPPASQAQQATTTSATGTVSAVNPAQHKVTLDHAAIPAINWPAMKMEFAAAPSVDLSKVKAGDKVKFTLSGSNNMYTVQSIERAS